MATDIIAIDTDKDTNTISITCSTSLTGYSAKRTTLADAPVDQQIQNIESKFDDKFDDPVYYFDDCQ
jgi:hypothetical protein